MFNKILFPVDLSKQSAKITPYVREMIEKFDAEVHVIYVVHVTQYYSHIEMAASNVITFESELKVNAEKSMEHFLSEHFSDYSVHSKTLSGKPGDEIVEYAKNNNIDLIIMGHDSTGLERAIFGSVAGYTVKYSPVPVLVISPPILNE